jgi:general secretion pathway protein A
MVVNDFGLQTADTRRSTLYDTLYQFLLNEHMEGRRSVLIIDEAQNMPQQTLEEVRMLSNFETEESYLLQIVLVGQPQLRKRLNDPALSQLTQRVSVYYHLAPLDKPEVSKYIQHRLKIAGLSSTNPIFTNPAIQRIYAYSSGIPRLISSICDTALLYGYTDEVQTIDSGIIERVVKNRGIQSGKCDNGLSGDDPNNSTSGNQQSAALSTETTGETSRLTKHLAEIEQRLDRLEGSKDHEAILELTKSLNFLQNENSNLRKQYHLLLHNAKKTKANKQDTSQRVMKKLSSITFEKKK